MKGQAYINGKDIWETWGASLMKGSYEKLLKPASMKEYISNSSRLEHGSRIIANPQTARTNEREISLQIVIEGSSESDYLSKMASFMAELEKGSIQLKVPRVGLVYKLVYTDCSSYGDYGLKIGKFTVKFIEPNTKDRDTAK